MDAEVGCFGYNLADLGAVPCCVLSPIAISFDSLQLERQTKMLLGD